MAFTETDIVDTRERALTIKEILILENMSLSTYYKLKRHGLGPVETTVPIPGMNFIRITAQARRDWHAKLAALQASEAGELESKRRKAHAAQAGKIAAASPSHVSKQPKGSAEPARRRR
jgi:hypothetical protein